MAVSNSIVLMTANDGTRMVLATITPDSSYPTGGEVITPNLVGLQRITGAIVGAAFNATPAALVGAWDQANLKLLMFQETGNAGLLGESSGDLSALPFSVLFFGV